MSFKYNKTISYKII